MFLTDSSISQELLGKELEAKWFSEIERSQYKFNFFKMLFAPIKSESWCRSQRALYSRAVDIAVLSAILKLSLCLEF